MGDLRDEHNRDWFRPTLKVTFEYDYLADDFPHHAVHIELLNKEGENAERVPPKRITDSTQDERDTVKGLLQRQVTTWLLNDGYFPFPRMASIVPQPEQVLSGTVIVQIEVLGGEDNTAFTVEFRTNAGNWISATYKAASGYYEKSVNTTGLADGNYSFQFRIQDMNSSILLESEPFNISVDNS